MRQGSSATTDISSILGENMGLAMVLGVLGGRSLVWNFKKYDVMEAQWEAGAVME